MLYLDGLHLPEPFECLVNERARYKAFFSGRGCAKSTSAAVASLIRASRKKTRILCCREVQKTIRESVKHEIDKRIIQGNLQRLFVSTANQITAANGSQFIFEGLQSARAISMQSLADIDIVWIEEASSISQVSLNILIPTIRKNGSELWFFWNPRTPRDPVDKMFRQTDIADAPVPDNLKDYYDKWAIVKHVTHTDNPFFPEVIWQEAERDKARDPDKYRHVWLGEYAHRSDAAVFRNWKVGTMDVPKDQRPYYGADWGFSVDPTVLVRCYVFPEMRVLYIEAEVGGVGIDIDKTPTLFDSIADHPNFPDRDPLHPRNWDIMADSARPETIAYMMGHGYPKIQRARKGPGSVEEGIEFIKTYDVIINPNCRRTIDEFTYYSYERDKLTDEVLPKLVDDKNHVIDAVRYAVENLRRGVYPTAFPEVVRAPFAYPGDPGPERNPALSPGKPKGPERGVIW